MKKDAQHSVFAQIEQEIPKILAKVSQKSSDFLTGEKSHRNAFVLGYEFLPLVIRLLISEEKFVNFCMENKEKFFGKIKPATKKASAKTPTKKVVPKTAVLATKKVVASPKVAVKPVAKSATTKPKAVATKPKATVAKKAPTKK